MPAAALETGSPETPSFDVWEPNWPAVLTFLQCETQWRTSGHMSGFFRLGLDYAALDVVLRRNGSADHVFFDVMEMERAALAVFREVG